MLWDNAVYFNYGGYKGGDSIMTDVLRRLCFMSVLFGTALGMAPEGSAKRIMNLLCSVMLICIVLAPLSDLDISEYALEIAKCREIESQALAENAELNDRLNRMVIEKEYEAYIEDKAMMLGIETNVNVHARWDTEGVWVPDKVQLECAENSQLSKMIKTELGIPEERQKWMG